ncbi:MULTISPECIES: cysteine--1-D-myo-inosityl 2-amino-2-deoxy-alpha-D-glucopyranoside ligase [Parafrankia]|uniref:cysteine--1-D-myo-inosityl 2-amino-2-deoxy-alpha-D-glucopyranoside ligase n=1 Tax=Parafrankia TaxID=2994362 RepID=UPI000A95BE44|nr:MULTISPECIES: cysteine--1-D-myo-inosityl 2-amino-2-deoxy-alpha-D-glucopyranoside ligase [Parafrankia]MBE3201830.1 cysteine--1-D-myo-inosityl 2-amino-2-deoxy-alpha-D-glucopyranoside ligase [Parafrankia sp. CH37]
MYAWPSPQLPRLPGQGRDLRVLDTASGRVRALRPGPTASLYVCGITPYDATHLGHAFTYLTYDLVQRVLRDAGHEVRYVQNVTDVDDPLLERADRDGIDWRDLARREIDLFRADMTALRVLPPDHYVGVVEAVPLIVEMIGQLVERGAAYSVEGDLYFSVSSAKEFGEVARLSPAQMLALSAERGGDPGRPGKKDPLDPLLWRAERPGEPSWPSPFGPGRPGWHVECSAIARHHLGAPIDIQGGGSDLVFPHHECSAAHAEVAGGAAPFARAYVHTAMVGLDGHKMSKSRGNLEFVSRLLAGGADPAAIRLALLHHHHTVEWEWTPADLPAADLMVRRWRAAAALPAPAAPDAGRLLAVVRDRLADGLDAPGAVTAVDEWVTAALGAGGAGVGASGASGGTDVLESVTVRDIVDALLGIDLGSGLPRGT